MKTKNKKRKHIPKDDIHLFEQLRIVDDQDLLEFEVEAEARKLLAQLRARGYDFGDLDLNDDGCIACLSLSVSHAISLSEDGSGNAKQDSA